MPKSPPDVPGPLIVFDAFHMDIPRHRLWRDGGEIPVRPKAWDVRRSLRALPVLRVPKQGLHGAIWPDAAVSDDTLTKVIAELRQALGDNSRSPRVIETVHGRGFRLVAEVAGRGRAMDVPGSPAEARPPMPPSGG